MCRGLLSYDKFSPCHQDDVASDLDLDFAALRFSRPEVEHRGPSYLARAPSGRVILYAQVVGEHPHLEPGTLLVGLRGEDQDLLRLQVSYKVEEEVWYGAGPLDGL